MQEIPGGGSGPSRPTPFTSESEVQQLPRPSGPAHAVGAYPLPPRGYVGSNAGAHLLGLLRSGGTGVPEMGMGIGSTHPHRTSQERPQQMPPGWADTGLNSLWSPYGVQGLENKPLDPVTPNRGGQQQTQQQRKPPPPGMMAGSFTQPPSTNDTQTTMMSANDRLQKGIIGNLPADLLGAASSTQDAGSSLLEFLQGKPQQGQAQAEAAAAFFAADASGIQPQPQNLTSSQAPVMYGGSAPPVGHPGGGHPDPRQPPSMPPPPPVAGFYPSPLPHPMGYPPPPHMGGCGPLPDASNLACNLSLGGAFGGRLTSAAHLPQGHPMPPPLHPTLPPSGRGFALHPAGARAGPEMGDMWGGGGLYSMGQLGQALGQYAHPPRPSSTPSYGQQQPIRANHMPPPGMSNMGWMQQAHPPNNAPGPHSLHPQGPSHKPSNSISIPVPGGRQMRSIDSANPRSQDQGLEVGKQGSLDGKEAKEGARSFGTSPGGAHRRVEQRDATSGQRRTRGKPPPVELRMMGRADELNTKLRLLVGGLVPPEEEMHKLAQCVHRVRALVTALWPHAKLQPFGSCISSFAVRNSDVDLCLVMEAAPGEELVKAKLVKDLGEYLEGAGMAEVQALPHARVPIVKLVEPDTRIACDICINNLLPLANTKLLRDYASVDPRLRSLVYVVKHWARQRDVNNTYRGTLSSYAYAIMCIHLLQTREPPILPCLQRMTPHTYNNTINGLRCAYHDQVESLTNFGTRNKDTLAHLLHAFFDYWAWRHDYSNQVASIRVGGCVSKASKEWTRRVGNERHLICIEDPFEVTHDLGRVVDHRSIGVLRDEFVRAAKLLREHPDPFDRLFEKFVDDNNS